MPALVLYGHKFHVASDDVPLFAIFGLLFHSACLLVILFTSQSILHMPDICHHAGRQYIATVTGLLVCFAGGLVLEILLILEGCKGGPFELSKRKRMPLLLTLRFVNVVLETAMSAYGTYVVFGTHVRCKIREDMYWNPKKEVKVLVILTWVFQVLILLNAYVWYNAWPDHTKPNSWDRRFRWIGRWILCLPDPNTESRQESLRKITRWLARLLGHLDLTPSDFGLALILVATLQRRKRRESVKAGIAAALAKDEAQATGKAPAMTVSLLQAPSLLLPLQDNIAGPIRPTQESAQRLQQHIQEDVLPVLSLLDSDEPALAAEQVMRDSEQKQEQGLMDVFKQEQQQPETEPSSSSNPAASDQPRHAEVSSEGNVDQQPTDQGDQKHAQRAQHGQQQEGASSHSVGLGDHARQPDPNADAQPRSTQPVQLMHADQASQTRQPHAQPEDPSQSVRHLQQVQQGEAEQAMEAELLGGLLRTPSRTLSRALSGSFNLARRSSNGRNGSDVLGLLGQSDSARTGKLSASRALSEGLLAPEAAVPEVPHAADVDDSLAQSDRLAAVDADAERRRSGELVSTSQPDKEWDVEEGRTGSKADLRAAMPVSGPLLKFRRQMSLLRQSCITPSGMEEELRRGLGAEKAVQSYTGNHWKVPAAQLAEVDHYARYAVAVYGVEPPVENRTAQWRRALAAYWAKHKDQPFGDDEEEEGGSLLEKLNYEAVLAEADIREQDLLYLSYHNEAMAHLPYLIALDTSSRSVVLAIRGTATMEDVITDSVAEPRQLSDDWLPASFRTANKTSGEQMYAHAGIVAASAAILADLDRTGILPALLHGEYERGDELVNAIQACISGDERAKGAFVASVMQRRLDCKGWRLMVTGHSLGAGAAALIAVRLRDRFPDVQCWAFCPPGGLMSPNLSRAVEPFVRSVVVGKDIVARTSFTNLARLLDEVVTALALCKRNKTDMLLRRLGPAWRHKRPDALFWDYTQIPAEALRVLEAYGGSIAARDRMMELIPPGRLLFLRPHKVGGVRMSWDAVWLRAEEIIKEGILVSPRMINDHYTSTLQEALRSAQHRAGDSAASYFPPAPVQDTASASSDMSSIAVQA